MSDPEDPEVVDLIDEKTVGGRPFGPIWEHFERKEKRHGSQRHSAECNYCFKIIVDGRPTNLSAHIKNCSKATAEVKHAVNELVAKKTVDVPHPSGTKKARGPKRRAEGTQSEITEYVTPKVPPTLARQLEVKVLRFIIMAGVPFSVADNEYFRDLLNTLQPNFDCPGKRGRCRHTVCHMFTKLCQKYS
jgi:hypothetical protein